MTTDKNTVSGKTRRGHRSRVVGSDIKVQRHHDTRVVVPLANVDAANRTFVQALAAPVSRAEVDTAISHAVMRQLVAGGQASSVKITLAVQNNIELLGRLTKKLLSVTEHRLDEMLDDAEGRDLVDRFRVLSGVSAQISKTILDFREMKLLIDTLRKLADDAKEPKPGEDPDVPDDMQKIVKAVQDNPAELFRVMNVVRYMRGGGDPLEGLEEGAGKDE